jgi:hypothetical protein
MTQTELAFFLSLQTWSAVCTLDPERCEAFLEHLDHYPANSIVLGYH